MTESYDFSELEFFTVGTLGPRGQRVFYLQGRADGRLVSLRLEKQQVAALADYLDQILEDLPELDLGPEPSDLSLREPVIAAWTVGSLAIAYAHEIDRLVLLAEELPPTDDEAEPNDPAQARFVLSREQVIGLIDRARNIVAAGRDPCRFCGRPLEPRNAEWCPCQN